MMRTSLDQIRREDVVNTGGGASSRKRSGRILTSESPLDGALYGAEQGQGIPQLVSNAPSPRLHLSAQTQSVMGAIA